MSQALDTIFHSLADSTRRDILHRLCDKELSVSEITENYDMSMPAVSKHLKVLERAGLINRRREGKRFLLKTNPATLQRVDEWMAFYREFWIESFTKMDKYLTKLQKENMKLEQSDTESNEKMELTLDFTFQAPIDIVFETLTNPEHIKHWHHPDHLNITSVENELKEGGEYRISVTLEGGDGTEMMFLGEYIEINRPNLLVYTQSFSPGKDAPLTQETKITIELKQEGDTTQMNFNQSGFTEKRALAGARTSWPQVYSRLADYVEKLEEDE